MWRIAIVLLAACAPTWTKPSYRSTAVADARATAVREHECPDDRVRFKRDATDWTRTAPVDTTQVVWEPGGVVGTIVEVAPRWTFVFDVCGEQHIYMRPLTDSPYRDPGFQDLDAPGPLRWEDL